MKKVLSLESLKDLDFGKVNVAFARHIKRAVEDCMDRPGDDTARQVLLTLRLVPSRAQGGECEDVHLECQVASKVPAHRSRMFQCAPRKGGALLFDDECPDDVNQSTFAGQEQGDTEDE